MTINDIFISTNFRLSEFASRDTGEVKIDSELVRKVQRVRDILNLPIKINSGYRTPERNRDVGGVPNSLHCQGKAVDISCAFVSLQQLFIASVMAGFTGVIVYTKYSFCHCDLREIRHYMVPESWVEWLKVVFPEYSKCIYPWSEVNNASVIEV